MPDRRFKELGMGTFFGDLLYDRTVPADHFLRQLERVVDWGEFTEQLIELYRGKGRLGRPPYDPAVILKMLVISYLHDISERMTETHVNENLPAKWFVGLAGDEQAPDHSTLTGFKRRIIGNGGEESLQGLLEEVVGQAIEAGVAFGRVQVVDTKCTPLVGHFSGCA